MEGRLFGGRRGGPDKPFRSSKSPLPGHAHGRIGLTEQCRRSLSRFIRPSNSAILVSVALSRSTSPPSRAHPHPSLPLTGTIFSSKQSVQVLR
jgi:hypothetical protein